MRGGWDTWGGRHTLPSSTTSLGIRSSLLPQPQPELCYLCSLIIQCFGEWAQLPTNDKLSAGLLALLGLGGALEIIWVAQWVKEGPSSCSLGQKDFPGFVDVDPDSSVLFGRLKRRYWRRKEG